MAIANLTSSVITNLEVDLTVSAKPNAPIHLRGQGSDLTVSIGTLPPCSEVTSSVLESLHEHPVEMSEYLQPLGRRNYLYLKPADSTVSIASITFTDANGLTWDRLANGSLTRDQASYGHRYLAAPVSRTASKGVRLPAVTGPCPRGDDELAPSEAWSKLVGRERQSRLRNLRCPSRLEWPSRY
jgi:hypothetical protein